MQALTPNHGEGATKTFNKKESRLIILIIRPWVYGQFSPTVLPAVCHLLHTTPYLRPSERANPVKVKSNDFDDTLAD